MCDSPDIDMSIQESSGNDGVKMDLFGEGGAA